MGEIGGQRGITEADVHRVGVVRHGHELRGGRLAGGSAVEQPHAREFAEVGVERDLGREIPAEVVVGDGAVFLGLGIVARGAVEGSGGHSREADLCAEAFVLEHHVHAHLLAVGLVDDAVGVLGVEFSAFVEVESLLVGVGLAPVVGIVSLGVEMVAERLGVGDAAAERVGALVVGEVLVHRLDGGDSPEVVVGGGSVAVDSVHHIVGEAEVDPGGEGAAGKSEPLPEEEGAAGGHALVVSAVVGVGVAELGYVAGEVVVVCGVAASFAVPSASEVHLGFEEYGGVLGEFMLEAHADTVAV